MSLKYIFILLLPLNMLAQNQHNQWFFSRSLGMRFRGGAMSVVPPPASPMDALYGSASWCDPVTGALLFYTNGSVVYNRFHQQMPGGYLISFATFGKHTIIVPIPGSSRYYYIFSSPDSGRDIYYCKVDLELDNGKGDVTEKRTLPGNIYDLQFTVVKQLYDNGYWFIAHGDRSNRFYSYRIGQNGLDPQPVVSDAGRSSFVIFSNMSGKMVSSSNGEQLLVTASSYPAGCFAQLFYFDKHCGTVTAGAELDAQGIPGELAWAFPCFSPNGKLAYISWFGKGGRFCLMQYNLSDSAVTLKRQILAVDTLKAIGDIQLGPDHKIYISCSEIRNVTGRKISVITNPDRMGIGCDFRPGSIDLLAGTAGPVINAIVHFPQYIMDVSAPEYPKPRMLMKNTCLGDLLGISLDEVLKADSFLWDLGDGTTSRLPEPGHTYSQARAYPVTLTWYICGGAYHTSDTVKIDPRPVIDLGNDTTLCAGSAMQLAGPPAADEYRWSTGDSVDRITVNDPGVYRLKIKINNAGCWGEGEVKVGYYPSISGALGDEYFICDDKKELVRLDAGEGFDTYRWTPTGDTSQWIDVADLGAYFVVVKDFRGCMGNDGATVKRRCPERIFFPNAFTPNGDGLNDVFEPKGDVMRFEMTIYNAWGEAVFETRSIDRKWDGTYKGLPAQAGVYIYKAYYEGYINRRLETFDQKGNITLLR